MQQTTLGRTGLRVSVAGLGCGGGSRLGLAGGKSRGEAADIVRLALDLGVNLIDTAQAYGTEGVVGEAIRGRKREDIVISTKLRLHDKAGLLSPERIVAGLNASLRLLRSDYVDVLFLHGLTIRQGDIALYDHAVDRILPALERERQKGKFRFLGATESSSSEPLHDAIVRGVEEDRFDVVMVAFSLFNQNARELVFPKTSAGKVGTMAMCVVRGIFADDDLLRETVQALAREGKVPEGLAGKSDPLDFLIHDSGAAGHTDAAYRYARHEPGVDVVLFGSGDAEHVRQNVASITAPPLPETDRARVREWFGRLVGIGLELPARGAPA